MKVSFLRKKIMKKHSLASAISKNAAVYPYDLQESGTFGSL